MWLGSGVAVAVAVASAAALIQPLAWEPPYAAGAAVKRKKKKTYAGAQEPVCPCPMSSQPWGLVCWLEGTPLSNPVF